MVLIKQILHFISCEIWNVFSSTWAGLMTQTSWRKSGTGSAERPAIWRHTTVSWLNERTHSALMEQETRTLLVLHCTVMSTNQTETERKNSGLHSVVPRAFEQTPDSFVHVSAMRKINFKWRRWRIQTTFWKLTEYLLFSYIMLCVVT
jgi:hypothetical protein